MTKAKRSQEVLDAHELENLFSTKAGHEATELRNLAMLRLMANTGLRSAEVLALRVKDISFNTGTLKVRQGKGGKDRILYLKEDDLQMLRDYLAGRMATNDFVFVGKNSKPVQARYLREMVKRVGRQAGNIHKDIHLHTLGHTFATDLYRSTKNLRLTQVALGPSNSTTTEI